MSPPTPLTNAAEERFWFGVRSAGRFLMGQADVQRALEKLADILDEHGIACAIIGAMALKVCGVVGGRAGSP